MAHTGHACLFSAHQGTVGCGPPLSMSQSLWRGWELLLEALGILFPEPAQPPGTFPGSQQYPPFLRDPRALPTFSFL